MKVLNLYYSSTGNTKKVAERIEKTLIELGHEVDTVKITTRTKKMDILSYPFVFVGSGVYRQLPGKALMTLFTKLLPEYMKTGDIKLASPRRAASDAVVYCTYGGTHTGINEAIPAVKYMGQLFDHLGYTIAAEWYVVGEYRPPEKFKKHSISGRLGDIRGRPNEKDLKEVSEMVKGIFQT
jgi:flavodoxin